MNPPPNPAAEQARADMMTYNAAVETHAAQQAMQLYPYYLTWPATDPAICCVAGQWRFADSGEIEAWYTREQLEFVIEVIEKGREAKHDC